MEYSPMGIAMPHPIVQTLHATSPHPHPIRIASLPTSLIIKK